MRTANRHTWLHALLVLSLVLAVPLLQGAGLHLHVGDHDHHDHPSPLHAAHDAEHVHHHNEAAEVDLLCGRIAEQVRAAMQRVA
jgi:hypothetical protein